MGVWKVPTGAIQHRAVLISHGLPDLTAGPAQRRAWQLLTMLSKRCEVELFCVARGPVHWEAYCRVYRISRRMWVEPASPWPNWLVRFRREQSSLRTGVIQRLATALQGQTWEPPASLVVCTHPCLLPLGCIPTARWRIWDLAEDVRGLESSSIDPKLLEKYDRLLLDRSPDPTQRITKSERLLLLPRCEPAASHRHFMPATPTIHENRFWASLGIPWLGSPPEGYPHAQAA